MTVTADIVLRSSSLPLVSVVESLGLDELQHVHRGRLESGQQLFIVQFDDATQVSEADLTAPDDVHDAVAIGRADDKAIYKLTIEVGEGLQRVYDTELDGARSNRRPSKAMGGTRRRSSRASLR